MSYHNPAVQAVRNRSDSKESMQALAPFCSETPEYWQQSHKHFTEVQSFTENLHTAVTNLGTDFCTDREDQLNHYFELLATHSPSQTTALLKLKDMLSSLSAARQMLGSTMQLWHEENRLSVQQAQELLDRHKQYFQDKVSFQGHTRQYLSRKHKANPTKEHFSKLWQQEDRRRRELEYNIRIMEAEKELRLLQPLSVVMSSFVRFFQIGQDLVKPFESLIKDLYNNAERLHNAIDKTKEELRATMKEQDEAAQGWLNDMIHPSDNATTGVRDFDLGGSLRDTRIKKGSDSDPTKAFAAKRV